MQVFLRRNPRFRALESISRTDLENSRISIGFREKGTKVFVIRAWENKVGKIVGFFHYFNLFLSLDDSAKSPPLRLIWFSSSLFHSTSVF